MKHSMALIAGLIGLWATVAMAQSPAEALKGKWVQANSTYCGEAIILVTDVEASGIVRGTFTCSKTKWTPKMGDTIGKNEVKGTLTGTQFVMINADGGGWDLTLNGPKLEGTGMVCAKCTKNPITYVKQ